VRSAPRHRLRHDLRELREVLHELDLRRLRRPPRRGAVPGLRRVSEDRRGAGVGVLAVVDGVLGVLCRREIELGLPDRTSAGQACEPASTRSRQAARRAWRGRASGTRQPPGHRRSSRTGRAGRRSGRGRNWRVKHALSRPMYPW
jgi:hypothetical protein